MTNNLQSNNIEKERMFDKATGKFNYICGDGTMENNDEIIVLKDENKKLEEKLEAANAKIQHYENLINQIINVANKAS